MEGKQFVIGEQLAQAVLNYLATRPYAEVFQLIGALQGMKELPKDGGAKEVLEKKE